MILEAVILSVRTGMHSDFEHAFRVASPLIASIPGYRTHSLQRCLEVEGRYLLLVEWETLESHTVGFRTSPQYQQWRTLLHPFYDPMPAVEHFEAVELISVPGRS